MLNAKERRIIQEYLSRRIILDFYQTRSLYQWIITSYPDLPEFYARTVIYKEVMNKLKEKGLLKEKQEKIDKRGEYKKKYYFTVPELGEEDAKGLFFYPEICQYITNIDVEKYKKMEEERTGKEKYLSASQCFMDLNYYSDRSSAIQAVRRLNQLLIKKKLMIKGPSGNILIAGGLLYGTNRKNTNDTYSPVYKLNTFKEFLDGIKFRG